MAKRFSIDFPHCSAVLDNFASSISFGLARFFCLFLSFWPVWQCQNIDAGPLSLARYFVSLLYFAVSGTYLLVFVSIMLILSRHLIRWAICNAINRMQIAMLTNANAIVSKSIAVYRGFRQKKDVLMKSTRYSHSFFFD